MRAIPLKVLASWPNPNYEDPVTRSAALLLVNSVGIFIISVAIFLRLYSRAVANWRMGMDDLFIFLAYVATTIMTATVLLANRKFGWDRHAWDVAPYMLENAGKIAFAAKLSFIGATTFVRISLNCFFYRLIKDSSHQWYAQVLHANLAFNIILGLVFVLLTVFLCL